MAERYDMSGEKLETWRRLLESMSPECRALAKRYPVNKLYRIKSTGMRGYPIAYSEDLTISLNVTGEYNRVTFSHIVFGLTEEHIEECELPLPGEDLGDTAQEAGYTEEDVRNILIPRIAEDIRKREAEGLTPQQPAEDADKLDPTHQSENDDGGDTNEEAGEESGKDDLQTQEGPREEAQGPAGDGRLLREDLQSPEGIRQESQAEGESQEETGEDKDGEDRAHPG